VIYLSVFDTRKIDLSRSYGGWKVCQFTFTIVSRTFSMRLDTVVYRY
jgi:hypothetical protein